jgi:3-isopropylmalate/(R)-2-methylmalate dehydratase large subunit
VGKDVILYLAAKYGTDGALYKALEFAGPGVASISMAGRFTIANMSAELGAKFAIFPFDEQTEAYLEGKRRRPARPTRADVDACYEATWTTDLSGIAPQVARPHDPGNSVPVHEVAGEKIRIDQAFIGSCSNGRMEDFRMAARILKGRKVHSAVRLIATPASQSIWRQCLEEGIWQVFADADAVVTNSTCGACAGIHLGLLGDGEVCISSSNRNFQGRMGSARSSVFLANAATVAAAAVNGCISDPREFL